MTARVADERPGYAGALGAVGGLGGHVGAPQVTDDEVDRVVAALGEVLAA